MAQLPLNFSAARWKSLLDPVIAAPMTGVLVLQEIDLKIGTNVINHKLAQMQQGWFLTDQDGPASIYRSAPFSSTTLTLTSSAAVTVNIGVF